MRRNASSKYSFEPKIPQNQGLVEVEALQEAAQKQKGMYSPMPVESDMSLPFCLGEQDGCVFLLPDRVTNAKLVVYEDGSCGLRMENEVFPISARFIGDSFVFEHGESACKLGKASFQLSSQVPNERYR